MQNLKSAGSICSRHLSIIKKAGLFCPAYDGRSVNFSLAPEPAHGLDLFLIGVSLLEFTHIHLFSRTDLLIIRYHLFLLVMKEVVHPADNGKADDKTDQETFPLEQYCQEHSEDDPADTDTYDPVSELLRIKSLGALMPSAFIFCLYRFF